MKTYLLLLLLFLPFYGYCQSNWLVEGELSGAFLSKSFQNVKVLDDSPKQPPSVIGGNLGCSVYHSIYPKLYLGISCFYQLFRNADYSMRYPDLEWSGAHGYYRSWDYINIPLTLRYNFSKTWATEIRLSNSFLVGKLDKLISKADG